MRKAASKQPAAPPHPTARSQAKEGPYAVPQPIRTLYRLQNGGERERWLVQTVQVDSRRPAGGGGFSRATAGGGVLLLGTGAGVE